MNLTCNVCGVTQGYLQAGKVWEHTNGIPQVLCPSSGMDPVLCCAAPHPTDPARKLMTDVDAVPVADPVDPPVIE
jgi:hypothetical protein